MCGAAAPSSRISAPLPGLVWNISAAPRSPRASKLSTSPTSAAQGSPATNAFAP